jgi:hypothetical protein
MRQTLLLFFLFLSSLVAQGQSDVFKPVDWKPVNPDSILPRLTLAATSRVQQQAVARLILHCCESEFSQLQATTPDAILECLTFEEIPLAPQKHVLLIEEGGDCFHSGTSGAVPTWLIRLDGDKPALLASPEDDFNGWLYCIQPSTTDGYRDIVLGWHWSAV